MIVSLSPVMAGFFLAACHVTKFKDVSVKSECRVQIILLMAIGGLITSLSELNALLFVFISAMIVSIF